ncbi:snapalysin [Streptomyces albipurpureus]|uniref:Extracellular small neutral protease n=1 Tax=Streptomyces albipurpureus TaxID=2897419 RepID=A0ABT0UHV7_9ACTN|nr:snapalysin [Streptomyces sp. CWNU-1]MCM2388038.1 snapalysin [Streptomyces sp. CWNU-1]
MRHPRTVLSATLAVGLGLAAALGAVPATAATPADSPTTAAVPSYVAYEGSTADTKATKAFFQAVVKSVAEQRAANPGARAVTVTYNAANAPSFRAQIARSAQIWNSSVTNVRLQEGNNPNFRYYEGNDARGSYASTDGRGRGYIFLDYRQNQQYNSYRVTSHETGHVLGLPDNYRGPCSELMSGGGPGPSCTNAVPNAQERARVNSIFAYGLAAAVARAS